MPEAARYRRVLRRRGSARASRASLWWLSGPFLLYVLALPLYNRVEPIVLGLPFFLFWMLLATVLTPGCVWLAARGDPLWQADREARRRERR
jgi:hypothetical protein